MSEKAADPRTAVMILVEVVWEDQRGTLQKCSARMENRSAGGACIRMRKPVQVGAKLRLQWRFEELTGAVRWTRSDGRDWLVGIQRDTEAKLGARKEVAKETAQQVDEKKGESMALAQTRNGAEKRQESVTREWPAEIRMQEGTPKVQSAVGPTEVAVRPAALVSNAASLVPAAKGPGDLFLRGTEPREKQAGDMLRKERKHMRRKWFELGHKGEGQEDASMNDTGMFKGDAPNLTASAAAETRSAAERSETGSGAVELLSMTDIYQTAGILNPRKGYGILKVVEMLRSEYLRGLSKEMKRASVLMALDAAGVSVEEVAADAKTRMEAIDSYETAQRRQFEALMAREKATFGNWLTTKQQETQNITEALELCLKQESSEPASAPLDTSLVSASAKPA